MSDYQTPEKFHHESSSDLDDSEELIDPMIQSFYDRTLIFDASLHFSSDDESDQKKDTSLEEKITIGPKKTPPSSDEIQKSLLEYYEAKKPVYKDFNDVTKKREVGYNILHIAGDSVKACPVFESEVLERKNLGSVINAMRQETYKELTGTEIVPGIENVNEYLISEETVVLDSILKPPTSFDAKTWVTKRRNLENETTERKIEDDSPAKIKIEKPVNVMLQKEEIFSPLESSTTNLSLSSSSKKQKEFKFNVSSTSPLIRISDENKQSSHTEPLPSTSHESVSHKVSRRQRRGRLSLSKKLQISRILNDSPDLGVSILKNDSSPPTSQTSQSSGRSNEPSETSVSLNEIFIISPKCTSATKEER